MKSIIFYLLMLISAVCSAEQKKYKTLILWNGLDEYKTCKRLEQAAINLGWEAKSLYALPEVQGEDIMAAQWPTTADDLRKIAKDFQPDFILNLRHDRVATAYEINYLVLSGCKKEHFDEDFVESENLLEFDGFLHSSHKIAKLQKYLHANNKAFNGIPWYLSCCKSAYHHTKLKKVLCWGRERENEKPYKKALESLQGKEYFIRDLLPTHSELVSQTVEYPLYVDGSDLYDKLHKAGIALILHDEAHRRSGTPSTKIFEAAQASCIIISDRNSFIEKEFGNAVLYVDEMDRRHSVYTQIKRQIKWIEDNPKKATRKAKRAHEIFVKRFTLEHQLIALGHMHERVTKQGLLSD